LKSLSTLLLVSVIAASMATEQDSQPRQRGETSASKPADADFVGTLHMSADRDTTGGLLTDPGNRLSTMSLVNDDPQRSLVAIEGCAGFASSSATQIIEVRAVLQHRDTKGAWLPGALVSSVTLNKRGILHIGTLDIPAGAGVEVTFKFSQTPTSPIAFAFKGDFK
jgi:hypothetical protein